MNIYSADLLSSTDVSVVEDQYGDYCAIYGGDRLPRGWRIIRKGLSSVSQAERIIERLESQKGEDE